MISYIISAYNRPTHLLGCVYSLAVQTSPGEIIITDNAPQGIYHNFKAASQISHLATYLYTGDGCETCYQSANKGALVARGDWLCFPSDDSYYVPTFGADMVLAAEENKWDLVYCDCVYDHRRNGEYYCVMDTKPRYGHIDKTNFIIKRNVYLQLSGFSNRFPGSDADGRFIERVVAKGIKHGKARGVMCVHN